MGGSSSTRTALDFSSISKKLNILPKLYQEGNNMMVSLFNIHSTLAFLAIGAQEDTRDQLLSAFGIESSELNALIKLFSKAIKSINSNVKKDTIRSHMFLLTKEVSLTKECENLLHSFNGIKDELKNAEQVNALVETYTNGKITQIVDSITDAKAILLNILYFKGEWETVFKPVGKKEFINWKGEKLSVPMMKLKTDLFCYEGKYCQYVELNYKSHLKALVLLPYKGVSLLKMLNNLDDIIDECTKKGEKIEVKLTMPLFKIESKFDLIDCLKSFGIKDAFDASKANFLNMFTVKEIGISEIIHKTFINVNEKGTEGGAATFTKYYLLCIKEKKKKFKIEVNRPFVFILYDSTSNISMFTAVIEDL